MINCLPKLIKNIQYEKLLCNVLNSINKYNGFDWKEHIRYNKLNSYASFTVYKNMLFELKLVGLDSRYFYLTDRHEWMKVLDNDIRICKPFVQKENIISHDYYKTLTPESNIYNLYPNEIIMPKLDPTRSN